MAPEIIQQIRALRARGKSFTVISRVLGLSRLTCRRWASVETYEKLRAYKREYTAKKRNPLMYTRVIPLGQGGWPKRAFIYRRDSDKEPVFIFNRAGPSKNWKGHNFYAMSLAQVKAWALVQPEFTS